MKLSVILPCYNGAATIAQQLDAVAAQDWPGGWELVVVNNGSDDASMDIVESYRSRLPSLTIVQAHSPGRPRLGVPHSYNCGIQQAKGDAFVFCEADDEVAAGWLAAMGEALAHHPFVVARLDYRKLNPAWLRSTQGDGYQTAGLSLVQCVPHLPHGSGCSFGLRRSLYEHLGPLSIEFPCVHDTEYSWRAQLAGYALHFEPRALIHYREKTAPAARFRQGRNWGHDFTRLSEAYGAPRPRLAVLRQTVAMARSLPRGAVAWLRSRRGVPGGRLALAEWIWDLGWATGKWLAWREGANDVHPPAPPRMVPAATAPLPPVH